MKWNPEEDEILRKAYQKQNGLRAAERALPNRSRYSCANRARRIGIKQITIWTAEEDEKLRMLMGDNLRLAAIASNLGRTKAAICWRCYQIGIRPALPVGCEYLTHAAKRTGFDVETLRRILGWHGVQIHLVRFAPIKKWRRRRHAWHRHYVDPFDVDDAVAAWMKTEHVAVIAKRIGMKGTTLRAKLERAGIARPERRKQWRVTPEEVDLAIAWRPHGIQEAIAKRRAQRSAPVEPTPPTFARGEEAERAGCGT